MNLIEEIKAYFTIKKAINNIKEAKMKPGWQTTEFWMTLATNAATVIGCLKGIIPANYSTAALAITTAVYSIARAFTKATDTTPAPTAPAQ